MSTYHDAEVSVQKGQRYRTTQILLVAQMAEESSHTQPDSCDACSRYHLGCANVGALGALSSLDVLYVGRYVCINLSIRTTDKRSVMEIIDVAMMIRNTLVSSRKSTSVNPTTDFLPVC